MGNYMIKVLFVCHGNICRSPMAQYIFQNMIDKDGLTDQFYIDSAATSTEEIGNGLHYGTRSNLDEVGIPYENHRAYQISKQDYEKYDYIIGMDEANIRNINRMIGPDVEGKVYKLLDYVGEDRDIADPWYTGNFDITYNDIIEALEAFLQYLKDNNKIYE